MLADSWVRTALLVGFIAHFQKLNTAIAGLPGPHLLGLAATLVLFSGYLSAAELNITPNQLPVKLGQYLDHWEDTSTELTIQQILSEEPAWVRSSASIPTLGLTSSAHWFGVNLSG